MAVLGWGGGGGGRGKEGRMEDWGYVPNQTTAERLRGAHARTMKARHEQSNHTRCSIIFFPDLTPKHACWIWMPSLPLSLCAPPAPPRPQK